MSFAAVAITAGATVASGYGAYKSGRAADKAAKEARRAEGRFTARLNLAATEVEGYAEQYISALTQLDENFDLYDMEEAFNSLYEGVIQPMERDFDENVLPGIQAAYSGGILGGGAGLSGAGAEAEAGARQDLSETKAGLRFQERGAAISRNAAEFERRANLEQTKFAASTAAPLIRAEQAPQIYQAQSNTIAAQLAAGQAQAAIPGQILSGAVGGASAGMSLANTLELNRLLRGQP